MTNPVISLQADWSEATDIVLPETIAPWMLEIASLTARLKLHSQHFRVQVLHESFLTLPQHLQPLLPQTRQAMLREVILWCNEQPCVYGQSWLPEPTVQALQPLAELGDRPLGDYIFRHGSLQRGPIEAAKVDIQLAAVLNAKRQQCWARRSVFQLQSHPLLVAEVFLPAIELL